MLRGRAARELDGGDRLEQREERAAERAGLLAGDDGDRVGFWRCGGGGARFGRGAAALLLRADDAPRPRAAARVLLRARDRVAPRVGRRGIARIERRDGL